MKKALSVILAIVIAISGFSTGLIGFAADKKPQVSQKFLTVNASPDYDQYRWGDTMTFTVDVTNTISSAIKDIRIGGQAMSRQFFSTERPDVITIDTLAPGETQTIEFRFLAHRLSLFERLLVLPITVFLGFISPVRIGGDVDDVAQVKVGAFRFPFGFNVLNETVVQNEDPNPPVDPPVDPPVNPTGKYAVTFNLNYNTTTANTTQYVQPGEKATEPAAPTRTNYDFVGWYTDASCEEEFRYDFDTAVNADMVLYAKWQIGAGFIDDTLDHAGPDVEIYSFDTDTYDILIGETKDVTFTSEIFSNIELADGDVKVVDENSRVVGTMHDNGTDGDAAANDGIYTLCTSLASDSVNVKSFHATANGTASNSCTVSFYRHYTTQDFDNYEVVLSRIEAAASPYLDENGYILSGKKTVALNAVKDVLDQLIRSGNVLSYHLNGQSFEINLADNFSFDYLLADKDTEAGAGSFSIATYQSFRGQWSNQSLNDGSDEMTDGSARRIADTFDEYTFSTNLDNEAVSLSAIKQISANKVVIINTHGGYNQTYGSSIALGERQTKSQTQAYEDDINAGRIRLVQAANKSVYSITGGFIEKYCGNMNGALIYLGACNTAEDMCDGIRNTYELAQAFINKGATAVLGTNKSVYADYDYAFGTALFQRLTESNNGQYYTLSQAFSYAVSVAGATDSHGTSFDIYPLNDSAARNYRLRDNETGTISGVIKNASNNAVIANALIRVYKNDELVASARTNSSGMYTIAVPAGNYIVTVSAGNYKTAKILAAVSANRVTYLETFLLLKVGLSTGFANGKTINAITGERLQNVTIKLRYNWNNKSGAVLTTFESNENGYYEIRMPAGLYTLECSKAGFVTTYKNIVISPYDLAAQDVSISPVLQEGEYRVVLTWGTDPRDLDSHLFGNLPDGSSYHVYYVCKNGYDASENLVANLDVDDTSSYGPETTTFQTTADGSYEFYVDWYSGSGTWASSGGKIEVYNGAQLLGTYFVPNVNNRSGSWKVFSITDGVYRSYNIIQEHDIY